MDLLTRGLGIRTNRVLRSVWESLPSLIFSEAFFSPSLNVTFLNVLISPVGSCLFVEPLQHLVPLLTLPSISFFTPVLNGVLEGPWEASVPVVMVCPTPQMSSPGEKQVSVETQNSVYLDLSPCLTQRGQFQSWLRQTRRRCQGWSNLSRHTEEESLKVSGPREKCLRCEECRTKISSHSLRRLRGGHPCVISLSFLTEENLKPSNQLFASYRDPCPTVYPGEERL